MAHGDNDRSRSTVAASCGVIHRGHEIWVQGSTTLALSDQIKVSEFYRNTSVSDVTLLLFAQRPEARAITTMGCDGPIQSDSRLVL